MGQLDGRIAVITGAGDGIGAAIAQRFVDEGAKGVVIAELNERTGQAMADNSVTRAFSCAPMRATALTSKRWSTRPSIAGVDSTSWSTTLGVAG